MDQTLIDIIDRLIRKTKDGQVNWQISDIPNEYKLFLDQAVISIGVYNTRYGNQYVDCKVTNNRGDIILRENVPQNTSDGIFLTQFFNQVHDAYTGKEDVISSILNQIKNDDVIGDDKTSNLPF